MDLEDVKSHAAALSMWAHIATVGADNAPDVTPVHPCWEGDTIWFLCSAASVKVRNVRANPSVAMHWQVTESGDGLEVWGTASFHDDLATKRRLWNGVFDYNLDDFAPGGPEGSHGMGFMKIVPQRALFLKQYGLGGRETWRA